MPLFNLKKKSVPAPEEPKKGVRQLMAEQESGCEIRHITDPKPKDGEVYRAEYWEIANVAGESFQAAADAYDKIRYDDPLKAAEIVANLNACSFERDEIDKAHPRLSAALPEIAAVRYDSLGSALCALEKALYGFDLSGRMEKAEEKPDPQPAPEEPKKACAPAAHPIIAIEIVSPEKIEVSCHGVCFDGGDPTGTYLSIEGAVAALDEAVADPYEREEKKGAKRKAS